MRMMPVSIHGRAGGEAHARAATTWTPISRSSMPLAKRTAAKPRRVFLFNGRHEISVARGRAGRRFAALRL
jgi:hypothetical protein